MKLAFGSVVDRPWGLTLGTIGTRRLTAELTLRADDKVHAVAFVDGVVAAATSPLASDSIARIALTGHLISSSHIGDIARRLAAAPERDEVDIVAEAARLRPEHVATLRHRVTMQRAARTFSLDRGEFEVHDQLTVPTPAGYDVTLGSVIYLGVRMSLSEQRLAEDLRELGSSFMVRRTASAEELASYGFGEEAPAVIEALREGATLAELEGRHREVAPRTLHAIVYALVSCGACDATGGQPVNRTAPPLPRTSTGRVDPRTTTGQRLTTSEPLVTRSATRRGLVSHTADQPAQAPAQIATPPTGISITRSSSPTLPGHLPHRPPHLSRTITTPRTITGRERAARAAESLLATRVAMLETGADHFALLGVTPDAPPEAIRGAYFAILRQLHADSLAELEVIDAQGSAPRVLAQLASAFAVLCDPGKRRDYVDGLKRGAATPLAPRARTGDLDRGELAHEAFLRGEAALRREQLGEATIELGRAAELEPSNVDYAAVLAWAQFCAAADKPTIAAETRRALAVAINKSNHPVMARFYLGRVERMLGRLREALEHFQEVLDAQPGHADAAAEVRFIEARLANQREGSKSSLFGRKR
ncbi:MAG: hypothetical protein M3680_19385 [Myxococcota bacterium]|nr:hypothetical protein [Myxococcota bacterium]